ncbi:hypothetical protein [Salmonirosea aquatica]|uniref:hypothetical protein n=1 Tax=Salmonirosea aquatica TaxID=2654236 RepID=UPI003570CCE0
MSKIHYFKRHNKEYAWHYYKLSDDNRTPCYEMIVFLTDIPGIHFMEMDLTC